MSPDSIGMQGGRSPDNVGVNFKTGIPTSQSQGRNQGAQQINRGALMKTGVSWRVIFLFWMQMRGVEKVFSFVLFFSEVLSVLRRFLRYCPFPQ